MERDISKIVYLNLFLKLEFFHEIYIFHYCGLNDMSVASMYFSTFNLCIHML